MTPPSLLIARGENGLGRIEAQRTSVLYADGDMLSVISWIYQHPHTHEQWIAPVGADDNVIAIFDSAGRYMRSLSALNGKPLASVSLVRFGPEGDALVVDGDRGLLYWLSSDGHDVRAAFPVDRNLSDALIMHDGLLLMSARVHSSQQPGTLLYVVDAAGTPLRSFGPPISEPEHPSHRFTDGRILHPAGDGHVWVASYHEYAVQLWSTTGSLVRSLHSQPDWFVAGAAPVDPSRQRPHAMLKSMQVDDKNRMWLIFQVPDAEWQPFVHPLAGLGAHQHGGALPVATYDRLFDTVIEVVDLLDGQLLASTRFNELFGPFVGPGLVARMTEPAPSQRAFEMWTLSLHQAS